MELAIILLFSLALAKSEQILEAESCGWLDRGLQISTVVYSGHDSIYILGGRRSGHGEPEGTYSRQVIRFNITDQTGSVVGEFPYLVANGAGALDPNGDILYFGGFRQRESVLKSSNPEPTANIFRIRQDNLQPQLLDQILNVPRVGAASAVIGDAVYLFGGDYCGEVPCEESTIEEYNMTTRNARLVGKFSAYRGSNSAVSDGVYAYIFGGYHTTGDYHESRYVHRFNPRTLIMESLGEILPHGLSNTGATIVDGKVFVMPGSNVMYGGRPDAYSFDTLNRTVGAVEFEGAYLHALSRPGLVYVSATNKVYMFGTKSPASGQFNAVYCLRLPTTTFECTGQLDGFYPHPTDCSQFILCSNEIKYQMECPAGLHFNPDTLACDHPDEANCNVE